MKGVGACLDAPVDRRQGRGAPRSDRHAVLPLIARAEAPIAATGAMFHLDSDTFVMDNNGNDKEDVARTYQGIDGKLRGRLETLTRLYQ